MHYLTLIDLVQVFPLVLDFLKILLEWNRYFRISCSLSYCLKLGKMALMMASLWRVARDDSCDSTSSTFFKLSFMPNLNGYPCEHAHTLREGKLFVSVTMYTKILCQILSLVCMRNVYMGLRHVPLSIKESVYIL